MSRRDLFLSRHRSPVVLNPLELIEYTRSIAHEVRSGNYPFIEFDSDARWHQRIHRDSSVDTWLISWLPTQGTQLHDHGGSGGAFTVVSGELAEAVYVGRGDEPGELHERVRSAGTSVGFDSRYVHDVRNISERPALSVHSYSRPLIAMNYYELQSGRLDRIATLATDDPEPAFDVRAAS
jgi:hypothetical protein